MFLALAAATLLSAGGAAIDYVRLYDAETRLQASLDGAVLAAASVPEAGELERKQIALDYFSQASEGSLFEGMVPEISIVGGTVAAKLTEDLPTSLMATLGVAKMKMHGLAEVSIINEGKVELALVLDYSGSMNKNQKYQSMRDAAIAMIDSLSAEYQGNNLKIGLVPFSAMVHTSLPAAYVAQPATGSTWTGCTQDRYFPYNTDISVPTADDATKWGYVDGNGENGGNYGCSTYINHDLAVVPLTSDVAALKSKISDMKPVGNTNIPLGAQFGWLLLDSKAPFTEASTNGAKNVGKFLVLLTDGVQTSGQFDSDGNRSVQSAESNLLKLCEGIRNDGITVYTIAYDITAPKVTALLQTCAPGNYYEPGASQSEIAAVFASITSQIKSEFSRLTR